ncbi:hypothetical protein IQ249_15645 [Lusitaniella coriacea LEGE 07157]|uniref:Uncharacterized protein n=1 Tax=Lusitaniella coriacea LEGE 07157 TaxID=945747 RepID=A0A8J7IU73_9CYAN|nr:hypothetical protein [Lusitaniella coriacea]MBE9117332.1 hypothetical protein [Lusitaniella coriacea LEGE 07157]
MNNTIESNQPIPVPSAEIPAPVPLNLPLPNWLLAVLLFSAISNRLYQISLVILSIVQTWKKSTDDQKKTE